MVHAGSSPRVRVTWVPVSHVDAEVRFIPACAGDIQSYSLSPRALAVHPRVCG